MTWMDELRKNKLDVKAELELVDYEEFSLLVKKVEKLEKKMDALQTSLRTMIVLMTPEEKKDGETQELDYTA